MENNLVQYFLLFLAIAGWIYCSFPMLRYMVDLADGNFRWQLVLWFLLMLLAIFIMKFSVYSITGWPQPGTWASRLFLGVFLAGACGIPFLREYISRLLRR